MPPSRRIGSTAMAKAMDDGLLQANDPIEMMPTNGISAGYA
jgi:hypothetical protein